MSKDKAKGKRQKSKVKSRLSFCLLTFAFCLLPCRAQARSNTAIKAFNEGVKNFNGHQFREAIAAFDVALSADSDFTEAYFARGACKYYLKAPDGALMDLNDALRLKSDYLEARALRGAVNYESDRWDNALEDFNYVLRQNPKDAQSLLGRGVILLKREDLSGAQRDFKEFLQVRPDDPLAPKVRELVASLSRAGAPAKPGEAAEAPAAKNPASSPARRPGRPVAAARRASSVDLQKLADSLLGHPLENAYDRKIIRGENAQAVGNIHNVSGGAHDHASPDVAPQIVDPR